MPSSVNVGSRPMMPRRRCHSSGFSPWAATISGVMTEAGAVFQSYLDGKTILLSPELSIETQVAIGCDIMMALDQCVASTADEATARAALELTQRWAVRSRASFSRQCQPRARAMPQAASQGGAQSGRCSPWPSA